MPWIKLFLNFSLLLSLLVAPCFLLMAYWYRRQMQQTLLVWRKPEMVVVTITFLIAALILFIVGISSLFTYLDFQIINPEKTADATRRFRDVSITCGLMLVVLTFTYFSIRMLLVRVITEAGIMANDRFLRVPDFRNVIHWDQINDYYLVSDYPNVIFTLIVQKAGVNFDRVPIRVPVYVREEFEDLLETKMFHAQSAKSRADISAQRFSEN